MSDIYEVNKYGAVDMATIKRMDDTIQYLITEIRHVREWIGKDDTYFEARLRDTLFPYPCFSKTVVERLKKLETLTKVDDYEFVTETKLVKKNKTKEVK